MSPANGVTHGVTNVVKNGVTNLVTNIVMKGAAMESRTGAAKPPWRLLVMSSTRAKI